MIVPNQAIATYVTQWTYDSHNRLLEMIYPDEEKITYSYNLGGQLEKVHGYKSYGYDYVSKIGYDKFEQRTYLKNCNGAETFYTYDPQRRRLQNLTVNSADNTIMDNAYTYDAVSNVLSVTNGASVPQSGKAGGQMAHNHTYDALYRLVSATGTYAVADNKTASYTLAMGYDNMHRITSKRQILTQNNLQFNDTLNAGYDLTYTYGTDTGKKFQLANVKDVNYHTEETPFESENVNNNHAYEYDANGNLIYVNTSRTKKDGIADEKAAERKLKWDEENRLLASDDNGFVTNYWYDADGERTVKTSGESDQVYVNSEFAGGRTNTAKFSLYVSPYLVANQGGRYTKHIYIGSQRVVSKIAISIHTAQTHAASNMQVARQMTFLLIIRLNMFNSCRLSRIIMLPLQCRTMVRTTMTMWTARASAAMTAAWRLRRHVLWQQILPRQRLSMGTSRRMTTMRRCNSTTTQATWVAVITSPILTARWCSISSMFLSGRCSLKSATTSGIHLTFSMRRNSTRRRDCITMGRDTMNRGFPCG